MNKVGKQPEFLGREGHWHASASHLCAVSIQRNIANSDNRVRVAMGPAENPAALSDQRSRAVRISTGSSIPCSRHPDRIGLRITHFHSIELEDDRDDNGRMEIEGDGASGKDLEIDFRTGSMEPVKIDKDH